MTTETDRQIESFLLNAINAMDLLYRNQLYVQLLVLIYSFIDSAGLLDAPLTQTEVTEESFKNWVKKYILTDSKINFNEYELWSDRCTVLHIDKSQSNISITGRAKELRYYVGPSDSTPEAASLVCQINSLGQIPVYFDGFYSVLLNAITAFANDLGKNCDDDQGYKIWLQNILQKYAI